MFTSDEVIVETSDHASLKVALSYNWLFRVDKNSQEEGTKIFNVKDPIADLCNMMASYLLVVISMARVTVFWRLLLVSLSTGSTFLISTLVTMTLFFGSSSSSLILSF